MVELSWIVSNLTYHPQCHLCSRADGSINLAYYDKKPTKAGTLPYYYRNCKNDLNFLISTVKSRLGKCNCQIQIYSPRRISGAGRQLIIHEVCVLDINWTIFSIATRGSILGSFTKPLSDCVTVLCLGQCKPSTWEFVEFWKGHATFKQIEYLTFLTGTFVVYAVGDGVSTCCYFGLLLLSARHLIGKPPLQRKLKSAFANKNSSLVLNSDKFHICGNVCIRCYFSPFVNKKRTWFIKCLHMKICLNVTSARVVICDESPSKSHLRQRF